MYNRTNVILLYDHTFEGLMTCIYECYYQKISPTDIIGEGLETQFTLCETFYIDTDLDKSERVYNSIAKKILPQAQEMVQLAFLSHEMEHVSKEMVILNFLKKGFVLKRNIMQNYSCDEFVAINKRVGHVGRESHLMKGFVRFSVIDNLLFAKINPKNNVLPIIAPHFADRYKNEPFIIYDERRKMAVIYKPYQFVIVDVEISPETNPAYDDNLANKKNLPTPAIDSIASRANSAEEQKYQDLWKMFYNTIAIEGRYNPKCRMSYMPKRFWSNLTELSDQVI